MDPLPETNRDQIPLIDPPIARGTITVEACRDNGWIGLGAKLRPHSSYRRCLHRVGLGMTDHAARDLVEIAHGRATGTIPTLMSPEGIILIRIRQRPLKLILRLLTHPSLLSPLGIFAAHQTTPRASGQFVQ